MTDSYILYGFLVAARWQGQCRLPLFLGQGFMCLHGELDLGTDLDEI